MCISIAGICGLEYYWISTAIEEKAQEFDRAANRALYATVEFLEKSEAEILIIEEFGQSLPEFNVNIVNSDSTVNFTIDALEFRDTTVFDRYYTTQVWVDEEEVEAPTIFEEIESEIAYEEANEDVVAIFSDDGQLVHQEVVIEDGDESLAYYYIRTEHDSAPVVATTKTMNRKLNVYKSALQDVFLRGLDSKPDFESRLGNANIDSLLNSSLLSEGIDTEFDWAVFNDSSEVVMNKDSENIFHEAGVFNFSVPVFPEFPDEMILSLRFPSKEYYVLKSLGGMLGLVLMFSVFMILTFGVTLNMILKQKKLSDVKSDFINNMTHEFKTPLATIGLALDSMRHPNVSSKPVEMNKFMGIIDEENKRLNGHVEKILQLAKMEKGQLVINKQTADITAIVEDVVHAFELKLSATNGKIDLNLDPNINPFEFDENHIFNVVANLVDNAIKYSDSAPEIKVNTSIRKGNLVLTVSDNGIGLSPDDQKKVFKTFYRAQKGDIHNVKGFGLGLSYSNEVVQLHGGEMTLTSTLGKGSTFGLIIPMA